MLDNLTLDQLRAFVAVVEGGSFRAGASKLSRVQSAISHLIGNLELELRVTLFDRTGRKPELTTAGRALLADAQEILIKVDTMRARSRRLREGVELNLNLAVDPVVPISSVAAALEDVRAAFPSIDVTVHTRPLQSALHSILQQECSLALTTEATSVPLVEAEFLCTLPAFVAVCSSKHPLAKKNPMHGWSAVDLAEHVQIVVADPSPLSQDRTFGVLSPWTWRVSDLATKLAIIRAGTGWGNLPFWMVRDDLFGGRLSRVYAGAIGPNAETALGAYLLRPIDQPLGPVAMRLRQQLVARLREVEDAENLP